jgi:AGZA family xanthine/uracil permease-like MFS transporter
VMARGIADLEWDDVTEYAPAVITAIAMPLTFSIATGIGLGFIFYVLIKLLCGRAREAGAAMWLIAAVFLVHFLTM